MRPCRVGAAPPAAAAPQHEVRDEDVVVKFSGNGEIVACRAGRTRNGPRAAQRRGSEAACKRARQGGQARSGGLEFTRTLRSIAKAGRST